VLAFNVALPPRNEQRRIVAKIEALTARSRRAREALDAIPPLLDKLRQSILAAAFRGDLTADWRAQHPDVEPAFEGQGLVVVEGERLEYGRGDIFAVPAWTWHYHENTHSDDTILFSIDDWPAMKKLGFYMKEEARGF
jgi:hypothetical protein